MTNNQFSNNQKNQKGFTLIELIVTMTIVAVLTTVAMISFGGTNKRARDGRRASDIQKIAIALEMARQVGGTYPVASGGQAPDLVNGQYLQKWPDDPSGYIYYYQRPTNYTYSLSSYMEDLGSTNGTGSYGNNCDAPGNCNYQVSNP
ncbi:type II secretion system protein [Candidatus Shapirobacteria bacterium]|nr:type II secretion system protein [Candidatus Shapirobacteria bacterium]